MWTKTPLLLAIASVFWVSTAIANTPITVFRPGPYSLDIQVTVDGELACDDSINASDDVGLEGITVCHVNLSDASELHVAGNLTSPDENGTFDNTFGLIDFDPIAEVLRDKNLDFGTRLDQHFKNILTIDPDISDVISIDHTDVTEAAVAQVLGPDVMAVMPPEMKALITRHIRFDENAYISPNSGNRTRVPPMWPSLTEFKRSNGSAQSELPEAGSTLRDWYDRVLVIYEIWDGKQITAVWDPEAEDRASAFSWIDGDTQQIHTFEAPDGAPMSAEDVLLIPYEISVFDYLDKSRIWYTEALKSRNAGDPDLESNFYIVPSNTPNIEIQLSFWQLSSVPFFKTVEPRIDFLLHKIWWQHEP